MTGFATVTGAVGEKQFVLEAKSVNHRYCEVNIRINGKYAAWEYPIQKLIKEKLLRGRIDLFVKDASTAVLDSSELKQIKRAHKALVQLSKNLNLDNSLTLETVLNYRHNYLKGDNSLNLAAEWRKFEPHLKKLIAKLKVVRAREGKALASWFRQAAARMDKLLSQIQKRVDKQPKRYRERMRQRFDEIGMLDSVDPERIASEVAILSDKMDVTEETVRLKAHLVAFKRLLSTAGAIGRQIDFLMQEIGREINTIAAKSQDTDISMYVVDFKTEIEKIREQAGNVE